MLMRRAAKFAALANVRAGILGANQTRRLGAFLDAALGPKCLPITAVGPERLEGAIERLILYRPEAVIVLGGDGTASSALRRLSSENIAVVPLPGGSLNRISKSVYGTACIRDILTSLESGAPVPIASGSINGVHFYCAAGYGAPMALAKSRESLRAGQPLKAAKIFTETSSTLFQPKFEYEGFQASVAVASPRPIDAAFGLASAAGPSEPELAVGAWSKPAQLFSFCLSVLAQDWRGEACVVAQSAVTASLRSLDGPLPVLIDGEDGPSSEFAYIEFDSEPGLVWRPSQ